MGLYESLIWNIKGVHPKETLKIVRIAGLNSFGTLLCIMNGRLTSIGDPLGADTVCPYM